MFQLPTYIVGIIFILISTSHGQLDPTICPEGPSSPIPDPNWHTIPVRFELMTELVIDNEVIELSQAFSTGRDSIKTNSRIGPIESYWNFLTNEHFDIGTAIVQQQVVPVCKRTVIDALATTSIILPSSLILKPSVLLGFDGRNQRNPLWGVRFDSEGQMRGIPTLRFKSCFYVNDIQASVAVTYHVSDVNKFHGYLSGNESIILQLDVNVTNQRGSAKSYKYNVFRYTPNPSRRRERHALETPTGVFCPNRTATLPPPSNIPERVSANAEIHIPLLNDSIISTHNLYDTEYQFTRFDAWYPDRRGGPDWFHVTEIHDFGVGLSYRYNHSNHHCRVTNINSFGNDAVSTDDNPSVIQMGNPQHLFLLDDIPYHYTGEKRCRDRVWCNVWIGEKPLPNNTVEHVEWYWSTTINDEPVQQSIPMKLIIKRQIALVPIFTFEMNVFNYRRNPATIFEIDYTLAECYRALGPAQNYNLGVLSFKIENDKNYPVSQNLNFLRLHIWETLVFTMFVRPTRISHLIVDQEDKDILVTFTLLDTPPRTGPVENPIKESSLETLITRLSSIIDSNGLAFRARYGTKQVTLRARPQSLNVGHRSTETNYKTSGPKITGLWLGLIIAGIIVGAVGGFIVFAKLS